MCKFMHTLNDCFALQLLKTASAHASNHGQQCAKSRIKPECRDKEASVFRAAMGRPSSSSFIPPTNPA